MSPARRRGALALAVALVWTGAAALAETVQLRAKGEGPVEVKLQPGTAYMVPREMFRSVVVAHKGGTMTLADALARAREAGFRSDPVRVAIAAVPTDIPGVTKEMGAAMTGLGGRATLNATDDEPEFDCLCIPPIDYYVCGWW